jgi:deoxyribodipyrimidine photo-lyase
MSGAVSIVWFRRDLRLRDNPALLAAIERGAVVPVFIWAPDEEAAWAPGGASRWWLHHSLNALDAGLRGLGSRLVLRRGPSLAALDALVRETGAHAVFWNRLPEPAAAQRDAEVERELRGRGLVVGYHNAALLFEPAAIRSGEGKPFSVFTPFWRACLAAPEPAPPLAAPARLIAPGDWPRSEPLEALGLDPGHAWTRGLQQTWQPGERGELARLRLLLKSRLIEYEERRDRPDLDGTSTLSPHLHFGEVSPREVWQAVRARGLGPRRQAGAAVFLKELGWREFAHHLLARFPALPDRPWRPEWKRFPWASDPALLRAWEQGRTGYPLVDAGMRQLWVTGWMHNRVRMVVASFLVKHLLVPWQDGERWFWDTLVDADLANNALNWQWVAGSGPDAAPYFRIFNPVIQSRKFDPAGDYIRRWVPALGDVPAPAIHQPWKTSGPNYPAPIVDHQLARQRALALFADLRATEATIE